MADEIVVGSVSVGVVPDLRGWNTKLRAELVPSAKIIGQEIGREISKGIVDNLDVTKVGLADLKKKITDGLKGIKTYVEVDVTKVNLDLVRAKIEDGLRGIKVNVELGVSDISIARTRRKINDGLKGIRVSVGTTAGGIGGGGRGGGGATP